MGKGTRTRTHSQTRAIFFLLLLLFRLLYYGNEGRRRRRARRWNKFLRARAHNIMITRVIRSRIAVCIQGDGHDRKSSLRSAVVRVCERGVARVSRSGASLEPLRYCTSADRGRQRSAIFATPYRLQWNGKTVFLPPREKTAFSVPDTTYVYVLI